MVGGQRARYRANAACTYDWRAAAKIVGYLQWVVVLLDVLILVVLLKGCKL